VESIPEGLEYPNKTVQPSVFHSWQELIRRAESSIDIASFYWSLTGQDIIPHPSDWQVGFIHKTYNSFHNTMIVFLIKGEEIYASLMTAGLQRGIKIRVAQNKPSKSALDEDTQKMQKLGAAEVRSLDFDRLIGAGILHTKLWVVDKKHFFVGSANMDWRSLTQVSEWLSGTEMTSKYSHTYP
jgi:phospholipase D3/4